MNAVVIKHVKVAELPEAWRNKIAKPSDAHVTVRIEDEVTQPAAAASQPITSQASDDPAFGIWRDREDMADVEAYVRKLRAPRYNRDGSRNS